MKSSLVKHGGDDQILTRKEIDLKLALVVSSLSSLPLLYQITRNPILYPFVDDWVLAPWLLGNVDMTANSLLQMVNGHQHFLIKLMLYFHGAIFGTSLEVISILVVLLSILTFAQLTFLTLNRILFEGKVTLMAASLGVTLILFTPRQFQNFFLIICAPWIISLFLISTFLYANSQRDMKYRKPIMLICLGLAPFSNGLGLALSMYVIAKSTSFLFQKRSSRFEIVLMIFSSASIFLSQIVPRIALLFPSPTSDSPDLESEIKFVLENPIQALKFIFVSFSNPVVPWSTDFLNLSIGVGFFIGVLILVIFMMSNTSLANWLFEENQMLTIGVLFSLSLLLSRFSALGVIGAIEPRYTTGSILVIAGAIRLMLQFKISQRFLVSLLLIGSILVYEIGFRTGFNYYNYRHQQSVQIQNCFIEYPRMKAGDAERCLDLILQSSLGISKENLIKNLNSLSTSKHF